jgi:hypothetical protein
MSEDIESMQPLVKVLLSGGLHKPPSVDIEPGVKIWDWSIREIHASATLPSTRHVVGVTRPDNGRTSSPIKSFNPQTGQVTTRSGRVYTLTGNTGSSRDSEYVWNQWSRMNEVTDWTDVSHEYAAAPAAAPVEQGEVAEPSEPVQD